MFGIFRNNTKLVDRKSGLANIINNFLEDCKDGGMICLEGKLNNIRKACQEGLINRTILTEIEIILYPEDKSMPSRIIFKIDLEKYELHIKDGDNYVNLDLDKESNKTLDIIKRLTIGANKILDWRSCNVIYRYRPFATEKERNEYYRLLGLGDLSDADKIELARVHKSIKAAPTLLNELTISLEVGSELPREILLENTISKLKSKFSKVQQDHVRS